MGPRIGVWLLAAVVSAVSFPTAHSAIISGTNRIVQPVHLVSTNGGLAEVIVYVKKGLEGLQFDMPVKSRVMRVEDFSFKPRMLALRVNQRLIYRPGTSGAVLFWTMATNTTGVFAVDLRKGEDFRFHAPQELFIKHETMGRKWMKAHVCVIDHPYSGVTDERGRFQFSTPLPPGNFTIAARHLHSEEMVIPVEVKAGRADPIDLQFKLRPTEVPPPPDITIPARKPMPVPIPDNRVVGIDSIRCYLGELKLPAIELPECSLAKALELIDAAILKTDPDKRVVPMGLAPRSLSPTGAPRLPEVKISLEKTSDQATAVAVLDEVCANATTPIAYQISASGITFSFEDVEKAPDPTYDLAGLDTAGLKELRGDLAARLRASRKERPAHDPVVMKLRQQLRRVDSRLSFLRPSPPPAFTNRLHHTSGSVFASNIMGIAPSAEEVRASNPSGVVSTYNPGSINTRRFHWAIRDSLENFGVGFDSPQVRIEFNHSNKALFARTRTGDEQIVEYWAASLEGPAQQVLLESVWVELPLADYASAPSLAGGIPGVLSANS